MNEQQKCVELLQRGMQHKRNGNLEEAINCYGMAFNEYPYNKDIYKNIAKIYMAVGYSPKAMKNLITYAQLTINNDKMNLQAYDFAVPFYDWSGQLNNQIRVQKNIVHTAVTQNVKLAKVVADLNLTFQAGFCFILINRLNLTNIQIPPHLLNNYMKSLLGQEPDGPTLADTEYAPMVRAIGLSYLLVNFITNPNVEIDELIDVYLSDDFKLDNF